MATNYPAGLDSFTNPGAGDALNSPSHAAQHANANDAIEAIETELGTNPKGSAATVKARLDAIETGARLGTNSIGATQLADSAVDTAAIQDGAVTAAKLATTGRFTFPTGAANGYGFTSGASHLSGTGSPEGVVTAAPGSTWLQTDATTDVKGWLRWIKATGTGNTGWQVGPEANTGVRDISGATMENGWVIGFAQHFIRRVGDTVDYYALVDNTSATADTFFTIPSGFRPLIATREVAPTANSTTFNKVEINSAGSAQVQAYNTRPAGTYTYVSATWTTRDAWPASLPGTAN